MVDVAELGFRAHTTELKEAKSDLEGVAAAGKKASASVDRVATSSRKAGVATSRFQAALRAPGTRNFVQQLNQVGQQTAATGNFMQALAIQSSDLLLSFGTVGIAIGALAPLIVGLGQNLFDTGDKAKELETAMDSLTDAVSAYQSISDMASLSTNELREKFGSAALEVRSALEVLEEFARAESIRALDDSLRQLTETFGGLSRSEFVSTRGGLVREIEETYQNLRDEFSLTKEQAAQLVLALEELSLADGPRQQLKAANDLNRVFLEVFGTAQNIPPELLSIAKAAAEAAIQAGKINEALEDSRDASGGLAQSLATLPSALSGASSAASDLAAQMANVAQNASVALQNILAANTARAQIIDTATKRGGGRGADPRQFGFSKGDLAAIQISGGSLRNTPGGAIGGGGTGSIADLFLSDLEALQQELATERELLDEWYQESLTILQDRRAMEILGEQEHREAMLRLEEEYQERLAGIKDDGFSKQLGEMSQFFGAAASIAQGGGDKMIKIAKVIGSTEALINSYRAAAQALADPTVGFWGKAAAYAATLATGLGAVRAITGASTSGGYATGPGGFIGGQSGIQNSANELFLNANLVGEGPVSQSSVREILEMINEAIEDGATLRGITVSAA